MRRAPTKSAVITTVLALLMTLVPAAFAASPVQAAGPAVFINEIHYDNDGTDVGEAVEIAGPAGTDLTGWTVVLYNGNGGAPYNTTDLAGVLPDEGDGYGFTSISYPANGVQNGAPDGLALVDDSGTVIEFLSYEGTITAVGGAADGMTSVDIGVTEGSSTPEGDSLQLVGTGSQGGDFTWAPSQPSTFGAINTGQSFGGTPVFPIVMDCGPDIIIAEGNFAIAVVEASDADDTIVDIALVADTVEPAGALSQGSATYGTTTGSTTTLDVSLDDSVAVGDFTATIEATNASGDVAECDITIEVESNVVVITPIHEVQGNGSASPLVGETVVVEAIVVGDFQNGTSTPNNDLNGFHIQEEDTDVDADPLTSEGIFVYDGFSPEVAVNVGDLVRIEGDVTEYFGLTQLANPNITVLSSDNELPTPGAPMLPVESLDDYEAFEGMRVQYEQDLVIAEYFNYDRFGEIVLTSERRLTPTAEFEPGPAAAAAAAEYELDSITLDDGRTNQNPDPARHPDGDDFDIDNLFRGGDTLSAVTGVVDYSFGVYRIQPTQGAVHNETNPRTVTPDDVGGTMQVATFNVLNYFTTLDDGVNDICGPAEDQECRGADDAEELTRQRDKIVAAIAAIDADVVGLIEIENNITDGPTADLVAGLNDLVGAGTYDYVATGAYGTDAIRQAFIYQPATVTPVGDTAILDSTVDPTYNDDKNRPALAQAFSENASGAVVTVAVNHFKSKGSDCDDLGDPDTGDGSANCNLTRTAAATAVANWLAGDPTNSGSSDTLIIGDLNSYDKETPIDVLIDAGYQDLVADFLGEDAYSYVFDGQVGYLDYQLANATLAPKVTGTTVWQINADEPDAIDYDTGFKKDAQDAIYAPDPYRSSDHDPVIVGLDLAPAGPTAYEAKAQVIEDLTAALSSNSTSTQGFGHGWYSWLSWYFTSNDDRAIERAIAHIEDSLNPAYWDGGDLLTNQGSRVFDAERRAVADLYAVWGSAKPAARDAIAALVAVDATLAQTAVDAAIADGGNSSKIARAEREIVRAERVAAWGLPHLAIWYYERAWSHAHRA